MEIIAYKLRCISNLHMGGDSNNLDVVDLKIERDPVSEEPTMNASGVKGALRDYFEEKLNCQKDPDGNDIVKAIFGTSRSGDSAGGYAFFQGDLLARPVRISEGRGSFLLATTPDLIELFMEKLRIFGWSGWKDDPWGEGLPPLCDENTVLTNSISVKKVEGFAVSTAQSRLLDHLFGTGKWILMSPKQLKSISLPVMTHNILENGTSKNLWYEEYVPHQSIFGLLIGRPQGDTNFKDTLGEDSVVQFGAEASTGCGFVHMEELS